MSYYSDIFKIYIQGPKGGVIRMLNAAICHVGMGCKIAERDSMTSSSKKHVEQMANTACAYLS